MDTEILRPNEPGDTTSLSPQGDDANWKCVDEAVADEATTYVVGAGTDLYGLQDHSVGNGVINSVKVYVRARYPDGILRIKIKTGGSEYDNGEDITLVTNYVTYSHQWNNNPGGGAWTWAQIDALQVGLNVSIAYCTQVYIEVDYTPAPPVVGRSFGFIFG